LEKTINAKTNDYFIINKNKEFLDNKLKLIEEELANVTNKYTELKNDSDNKIRESNIFTSKIQTENELLKNNLIEHLIINWIIIYDGCLINFKKINKNYKIKMIYNSFIITSLLNPKFILLGW